jgi:hypothetical protein
MDSVAALLSPTLPVVSIVEIAHHPSEGPIMAAERAVTPVPNVTSSRGGCRATAQSL